MRAMFLKRSQSFVEFAVDDLQLMRHRSTKLKTRVGPPISFFRSMF